MRLDKTSKKIVLSPEQIREIVNYIKDQKDINALFLYGSYGTPSQTVFSDVDLAILPLQMDSWTPSREDQISLELARIGGSDDVNVTNLWVSPVTLQMKVLETGKLLYVRSEIALSDFTEHVIRRYCDFEPDLRALYRDFDAGLREEFC